MNQPLPLPTKRDELEHPTVPAVEERRALSLRTLQQLQRSAHKLYEHQLFREATTLFKCLTTIAPTNPDNWYWLGRSYYAVGDPMGAAHAFELGGRLSHGTYFRALAAEAWQRAGYPQRACASP